MKILFLLAIINFALFYGTWAQVLPGGRVCIDVTHDFNLGSITSKSALSLCDDATYDHYTSLGPVFPISATFRAPPTTIKPSALESSSSTTQGTAVNSPSWHPTSSTGQPSSITVNHTSTATGEKSDGPGNWSISSSSLAKTWSGALSASLASSIPVPPNTASATSSPTTLIRNSTSSLCENDNTSSTTKVVPSTSKPESAPYSNSTTTTLLSSKALQTSPAAANSTAVSSTFIPTLLQPTVTSSNSSITQSRVSSTSTDIPPLTITLSASPVPTFKAELSTATESCSGGSTVVRDCQEGCSAFLTTIDGSVSSRTICFTTSCSQTMSCNVEPSTPKLITAMNRLVKSSTTCFIPSPTSANLMSYYRSVGFSNPGWVFGSMLPDDDDDGEWDGDPENPNDAHEAFDNNGEPVDLRAAHLRTSTSTKFTFSGPDPATEPTLEPTGILDVPEPILPGFVPAAPLAFPPFPIGLIPIGLIPILGSNGKISWSSRSAATTAISLDRPAWQSPYLNSDGGYLEIPGASLDVPEKTA